jgi:F-type H+-transporting ATPase subunit b
MTSGSSSTSFSSRGSRLLRGPPLAAAFRKRQDEIEERRQQAEKQRVDAQRLTAEIRERTAKIERDIEEIRQQGVAEGESARAELAARADKGGRRAIQQAQEEIARRLAEAKAELQRAAAELTAGRAAEILSREITDEDRHRLLEDSVDRLKQVPR